MKGEAEPGQGTKITAVFPAERLVQEDSTVSAPAERKAG
jgi:hypothetical protein